MTKKSSSKKVAEKSRERRLKPEDFDEIDEFAAQRERVGLDDSEIDSEEDYADFDEEAILNVPDSMDFDESEVSEEDSNDVKSRGKVSKKEKIASLRVKSSEKGKKDGRERAKKRRWDETSTTPKVPLSSLGAPRSPRRRGPHLRPRPPATPTGPASSLS